MSARWKLRAIRTLEPTMGVLSQNGWQEYAISDDEGVFNLGPGKSTLYMRQGCLVFQGDCIHRTKWIGRFEPAETLVVRKNARLLASPVARRCRYALEGPSRSEVEGTTEACVSDGYRRVFRERWWRGVTMLYAIVNSETDFRFSLTF